jgi:isopentenyl-diphosphate delta-isomerase
MTVGREQREIREDALTAKRKGEHIRICLEERVEGEGVTTGFEKYRFVHNALPELDFESIRTETRFLDKPLRVPLLVSSMTGGTAAAASINRRLAEAAEARGWAIALGSMRAAIEREELAATFRVRKEAPNAPIIANLGAVQLNYGYGADECRRAVELAEADALVLHLNGMQELFQPEGDTNFGGLLRRIAEVCRTAGVPVGVKEVGFGFDADTAAALHEAGVAFLDVAGAGGTSWIQVEKFRSADGLRRKAAEAFADWGLPTSDCVKEVRDRLPDAYIIASGGLHDGVEAAKAIALGADLAGFGRTLLRNAASSDGTEQLEEQFERIEFELRATMFGIGASTIEQLRTTDRLRRLPT